MPLLRYSDLEKGADLKHTVERAFGDDGLGIVVVTGVLGISDSRRELFTLGHRYMLYWPARRACTYQYSFMVLYLLI